jgi:hypothetical protein
MVGMKFKEKREKKNHYSLSTAILYTQAQPSGREQLETSNTNITEGGI